MARTGGSAHPETRESTPLAARVFAALCDGRFHSGEQLARALGVSRSAIWKAAGTLRELGATLHAVRNRGYRLARAGGPLDAGEARERLAGGGGAPGGRVGPPWSPGSANRVLLAGANPPGGAGGVFLPEYQAGGRWGVGGGWVGSPGGAICLSLSWTFREQHA